MANFTNHILTQGGQALIAQAHLGRKLTFTKISVGSGNVATPINATALADHKMDVGITSIQRDAIQQNWVRVRGVFNNVLLTAGFNYREMGLFARIDNEPEVLYSYVADSGAGDLIPAYDGANPVIVYPTMIVIIESTIPIHADITIGADFEAENIGPATVGPGVYSHRDGNVFKFRRLREGASIEITQDNGTITIGQKVLRLDLDLYVPLTHPDAPRPEVAFPTIQAAWDSLRDTQIPAGRQATIHVGEGRFILTEPLRLLHPNGDRISIIGVEPRLMTWYNGPSTWGGSAGWWWYQINVDPGSSGLATGDVVSFSGSGNSYFDGPGQLVEFLAGNWFSVVVRAFGRGTTPVGTPVTGGVFKRYPTQLETDMDISMVNIGTPGLALFRNIALKGLLNGSQDLFKALTPPAVTTIRDCAFVHGYQCVVGSGFGSSFTLRNSYFGDCRRAAIAASGSGGINLQDCSISFAGYRGIWAYGSPINIEGVTVYHCQDWGIVADAGASVQIGSYGASAQQNTRGIVAAGGGSVIRITGGGYTIGNSNTDITAIGASTVFISGEFGYMTANTYSPPVNTVGNQNSIIIR